jgi:hypothetical protein
MLTFRVLVAVTVLGGFCLPGAGASNRQGQRFCSEAARYSCAKLTGLGEPVPLTSLPCWNQRHFKFGSIARTQFDGIDVYYRADHPQTDFKRPPSGRIGIRLSARDTHGAQYAFQFAHEFCHALANYNNDSKQLVNYQCHSTLF